jgi:hypothetical protein
MKYGLLVLLFLALSGFACDNFEDPEPESLPFAAQVDADQNIFGKVYLLVHGTTSYSYESSDYGQTWERSSYYFTTSMADHLSGFEMRSGALYFRGTRILGSRWAFFSYFSNWNPIEYPFVFPEGKLNAAVSRADPSVVYLAMGAQGVLIGPNPEQPGAQQTWHFASRVHGQPRFTPNFAPSWFALLIVAIFLLVPPWMMIQGYLLARVWRYAFPAEQDKYAIWLALVACLIITLAMAGIIFMWLTDRGSRIFDLITQRRFFMLVSSM